MSMSAKRGASPAPARTARGARDAKGLPVDPKVDLFSQPPPLPHQKYLPRKGTAGAWLLALVVNQLPRTMSAFGANMVGYMPLFLFFFKLLPRLVGQQAAMAAFAVFVVWALRVVLVNDKVPLRDVHLRKRVCVIGGGMAGIVTAKELLEEGHEVVIYEKYDKAGGIWTRGKRGASLEVWPSSHSTSSSMNTTFSDYTLKERFEDQHHFFRYHVSQENYAAYLREYAREAGINRCFVFNAEVTRLRRDEERGTWGVDVTVDGEARHETFDAVAHCTGFVQRPNLTSTGADEAAFKGRLVHASEVKGPAELAGKRVLVVGAGETSSDIIAAACTVSKSMDLTFRQSTHVAPRNAYGLPPDYIEARVLFGLPGFFRWVILMQQMATFALWYPALTHQSMFNPFNFPRFMFREGWKRVVRDKFCYISRMLVCKSDSVMYALDSGLATLRPVIKGYTATGVTFEDGTSADYDVVIRATGYRYSYDTLPEAYRQQGAMDRYKYTFHPDLPDMAFIGYVRGQFGGIAVGAEMQARWFALLCSGKRWLPPRDEMQRHVAWVRTHVKSRFPTRGTNFFANHLARTEVGCEPDMLRLFLRSPRIWWHVFNSSMSAVQYRFNGPNAKPEKAHAYYENTALLDVPLQSVAFALMLLAHPAWIIWSRLPITRNFTRMHPNLALMW